ncbi:MAG: hypothetical protein WA705_00385 [Candidatus Ozemobacteraceae bacterium]
MNKILVRDVIFAFAFVVVVETSIYAQSPGGIPQLFAPPPETSGPKTPTSPSPSQSPSPESGIPGRSDSGTPTSPSSGFGTATGSSKAGFSSGASYDAAIDNHLVAPANPIGLFGCPIRDVENELRRFGARPYSYAFGKYSRFTLSAYLLTLHFDRYRKLCKVDIEPKKPFSAVEPFAQKELMAIFLKGNSLESLKLEISKGALTISYVPPDDPTSNVNFP